MPEIDPVTELLAIERITRLKGKYWRTVDTKRFDEFRTVFADDVELDLPGMQPADADEFVRDAAAFLDGALSVHHGHNAEIEVVSADAATGRWAFQDYVEWAPVDGRRRAYRGCGRYVERYGRGADGEWHITFMQIRFTRVDALTGPPLDTFEPLRGGIEPIAGAYQVV